MVTDPASLDSTAAATSLPPSRNPKTARRLHGPFVSPEFGASAGQGSPRLSGGVDGNGRGRPSAALRTTGDAGDQAAPLYTVNAGRADRDGALIARPSPLTESLLLGKRMSAADAGRLSVGGSASETALVPVGLKGVQFQPKPDKVPPPYASSGQIEASSTIASPLRSPQDVSPLVTDAVCTWGQELVTVLGQAVLDAAPPAPRKDACWSSSRPRLTTTGLFPQIMTLRFSSSVHLTSVHLRASSVLRLVVKPGDDILGDGHSEGRTVTLPVFDGRGESRGGRSAEQDIDVDVRDVPRFESTRSLTVTIAAGSEAFCSIHRIYALGVRV